MTDNPLDNFIWSALSGEQAAFSIGGEHAKRFDPAIGPLAGLRDLSPESLAAFAQLVRTTGTAALGLTGVTEEVPVPGTQILRGAEGVQMVFGGDAEALSEIERASADPRIVALGESDYPEMLELALLTEPGPFAERTGDLGQFWGIRENGRLLAMAGQRVRTASHVEGAASAPIRKVAARAMLPCSPAASPERSSQKAAAPCSTAMRTTKRRWRFTGGWASPSVPASASRSIRRCHNEKGRAIARPFDHLLSSTCSKSSSTGVARPKIETATLTLFLSKSSSSTRPLKLAKGPSRTFTESPIS